MAIWSSDIDFLFLGRGCGSGQAVLCLPRRLVAGGARWTGGVRLGGGVGLITRNAYELFAAAVSPSTVVD